MIKTYSHISHCEAVRPKQTHKYTRLPRRYLASYNGVMGLSVDEMIANTLLIVCVLFLGAGCDGKIQERVYEEIVIQAPIENSSMMTNDPHAQLGLNNAMDVQAGKVESDLSWVLPDGWQELAGGGMRVASFKNAKDPGAVDVSIVSLSGEAGGLESNLIRWALQIGIDLKEDPKKLKDFIGKAESFKIGDGPDVQLFDFSNLQGSDDPSIKSMIASMIQTNKTTVFVKMTGTIKAVNENLESFKALTQSVRQK